MILLDERFAAVVFFCFCDIPLRVFIFYWCGDALCSKMYSMRTWILCLICDRQMISLLVLSLRKGSRYLFEWELIITLFGMGYSLL